MPLAPDAVPWTVTFTVRDDNGKKSTISFTYPNTIPYTDAISLVPELEARLAPLLLGQIIGATITRSFTQSPFPAALPASGAEVEQKIALQLRSSARTISTFEIPTGRTDLSSPGTDLIPNTQTDIAALAAELVNGNFLPGNGAVNSNGLDFVEFVKAYETHRNRKPNI